MNRSAMGFLCFYVFLFTAFPVRAETPANELPMYGHVQKDDAQKKKDDAFVADALKEYGDLRKASQAAVQAGWEYFNKGDYKAAMRRFNQAWLLDSDSAEAFHGFGVLLGVAKRYDESIEMIETALKKDSGTARLFFDAGLAYGQKADTLKSGSSEQKKMWKKTISAFEKTVELDSRFYKGYEMLVKIYYNLGEYDKAWDAVHRAQAAGGSFKKAFLNALSAKKTEPQKKK